MSAPDPRRRLHELLADKALGLLASEQERELSELDPEFDAEFDTEFDAGDELASYERAAAAAMLALLPARLEPLPRGLRERLAAQAQTTDSGDGRLDLGFSR